jgi:hypothetical protein
MIKEGRIDGAAISGEGFVERIVKKMPEIRSTDISCKYK